MNLMPIIAIINEMLPAIRYGILKPNWAIIPPAIEPIGIIPQTNVLLVPWIRPKSSFGIIWW